MINKQLINLSSPASGGGNIGEEGLILHLDANDVDSYDGDGSEWVDITDHEYKPTTNVSEHFNTVLYTGNSGDKTVTGVGFAPDLVWIKNRDGNFNHLLRDTVRGNDSVILPNTTTAENTSSGTFEFLDDGFRLPIASSGANNSAYDYVAWCFKAGGAPTATNTATSGAMAANSVSIDDELQSSYTPTEATIYPKKISANTKLGFSTVLFTGTGNSNNKVPHGLGVPPELVIFKNLDKSTAWTVGAKPVGWNNYLVLNESAAAVDFNYFDDFAPNSNVFEIYNGQANTGNDAGSDFIAYCFASKRGVSKVGGYVGTGATNKVYTGFEPAFIIGKGSSGSASNWWIFDNKRGDEVSYPNLVNDDDLLSNYVNFDRDGFTLSDAAFVNESGRTFVYYAVAKNTNETSLIPDKDDFTAGSIETTNLELDLDANDYSGSGNWLDGTSNNNDGTITGAAYVNDSSSDYFNFDGVDDYVQTSYSPTGLNSITAEYWVNADVVGATKSLGVVFFNGGGRIDFSINSNSNNTPTVSSNVVVLNKTDFIGNWNHVTIVLTGLASTYNTGGSYASAINASIYYNGEFINTVNPQPYQTPVLGARLGRSGGGYYFDGKIGQARIYSSALTPTQIKSNYDATKIYALADLELHLDAASFPQKNEAGYSNEPSTWTALTGSNGTITGATFDSELGNWLNFDGSDDYISFPQFDISSDGVFTLEMWVNPASTQNQYANLFDYGHDSSNGFTLQQSNTSTNNYYFYAEGVAITFYIPPNQWTQVVVTVDANNIGKFYLDGLLIGTSQNLPVNTTGRTLNIGRWAEGASRYWRGKIGQVRTYSSALTQDQIRQNYNFTKPSYPNGNDGTISGATWNALGYFNFVNSNRIDITTVSPVSLSIWVKPDLTSGIDALAGHNSITSNYIYWNSGDLTVNGAIFTDLDKVTDWTHIAIVESGSNLLCYKNGVLLQTITGSLGDYNLIGARTAGTAQYLNGQISKVKVYDKPLTQEEITALYNEGQ